VKDDEALETQLDVFEEEMYNDWVEADDKARTANILNKKYDISHSFNHHLFSCLSTSHEELEIVMMKSVINYET
jgi:hypothetical protein